LSATRPNLIFIVVQREEEVQHMVQTRDKLHKAVERYKTEYNNLVARDVEEQVTHFKSGSVKFTIFFCYVSDLGILTVYF
jgi:hypothetical protein